MASDRLTAKTLREWKELKLREQGGLCALCGEPILSDPVGDHDHETGCVRGVLHRGCNTMLGKIESPALRTRTNLRPLSKLLAFVLAVPGYITASQEGSMRHPLHRNDDEKRERRNKKARARRAKKAGKVVQPKAARKKPASHSATHKSTGVKRATTTPTSTDIPTIQCVGTDRDAELSS